MFRYYGVINVKNYQFKTECKGDISHAAKTVKSLFDPVICKTPDAPLQDELLCTAEQCEHHTLAR